MTALHAPTREPDTEGLDDQDAKLLAAIRAAHRVRTMGRPFPVEGDLMILPDGTRARVAHVWLETSNGTLVQPSSRGASVHIRANGSTSYSGGLTTGVTLDRMTALPHREPATFWMWHHGKAGAHRGVDVQVLVRVWTVS